MQGGFKRAREVDEKIGAFTPWVRKRRRVSQAGGGFPAAKGIMAQRFNPEVSPQANAECVRPANWIPAAYKSAAPGLLDLISNPPRIPPPVAFAETTIGPVDGDFDAEGWHCRGEILN